MVYRCAIHIKEMKTPILYVPIQTCHISPHDDGGGVDVHSVLILLARRRLRSPTKGNKGVGFWTCVSLLIIHSLFKEVNLNCAYIVLTRVCLVSLMWLRH